MQSATRQGSPRRTGTRYNIILPSLMEQDLEDVASKLEIPKAEVFRRALTLYKHAINADKVEFTRNSEKQTVLVK
jgi:hypothetical protein